MSILGVIKGVWNAYGDEARRQELSHWRGVGKWGDDEKWLSIGRETYRRLETYCRMLGIPSLTEKQRVYLEWGPGGGSNAFALRDVASKYYGVDISAKNLQEAERVLSAERYRGFKPVLLEGAPGEVAEAVREPVDVFISTAVFQHFPSLEYGVEVLKALRSLCSADAFGLIQIRYDDNHPKFIPISQISEYDKSFVTATSYRLETFASICADCGFKLDYIANLNKKSHYATFYMRAK